MLVFNPKRNSFGNTNAIVTLIVLCGEKYSPLRKL